MAGLEKTTHPIEKEGIKRGKRLAAQADGILLVLDGSRKETQEDLALIKKYRDRKPLILLNKMDLPQKIDKNKVTAAAGDLPAIGDICAAWPKCSPTQEAHSFHVCSGRKKEGEIVLHLRQKLILEDIQAALNQGQQALEQGYGEEIVAEEIRKTLSLIGQITGEIQADDILEDIFSRFCIGK